MEGIKVTNIMDLVKKADERWKEEAAKRKAHEEEL